MQNAWRRESWHGKGTDELSFHHYVPSSKSSLPLPGGRCLPANAGPRWKSLWARTFAPDPCDPSGLRNSSEDPWPPPGSRRWEKRREGIRCWERRLEMGQEGWPCMESEGATCLQKCVDPRETTCVLTSLYRVQGEKCQGCSCSSVCKTCSRCYHESKEKNGESSWLLAKWTSKSDVCVCFQNLFSVPRAWNLQFFFITSVTICLVSWGFSSSLIFISLTGK